MTKLASVTRLRPVDRGAESDISTDESELVPDDYWARMQALRAELAELRGAG